MMAGKTLYFFFENTHFLIKNESYFWNQQKNPYKSRQRQFDCCETRLTIAADKLEHGISNLGKFQRYHSIISTARNIICLPKRFFLQFTTSNSERKWDSWINPKRRLWEERSKPILKGKRVFRFCISELLKESSSGSYCMSTRCAKIINQTNRCSSFTSTCCTDREILIFYTFYS